MVFEEDTSLILTVDPVIDHDNEHIIRTMTDIMESKIQPILGTVHGNLHMERQLLHVLEVISRWDIHGLKQFYFVVSCGKVRQAEEIVKLMLAE